MPTKKRRVGFIPRSDVLDLINKLSFENNLSYSKIINILVEEALYKRGMFDNKTGKSSYQDNSESKVKLRIKNSTNDLATNFKNNENNYIEDAKEEDIIDKEIYAKFLMYLQFQEKMKKNII